MSRTVLSPLSVLLCAVFPAVAIAQVDTAWVRTWRSPHGDAAARLVAVTREFWGHITYLLPIRLRRVSCQSS